MNTRDWNHNIHYHELVLDAVPPNCQRALDVGCGLGLLAEQLARRSRDVIAIDVDRDVIARAQSACASKEHIAFIDGDALTHPFPAESFDFITAVAALHHLPLRPTLTASGASCAQVASSPWSDCTARIRRSITLGPPPHCP